MRCLLVDDEPGIREGLAALLRRKGHDVRTAADCSAARAALVAESFDVVVTDWRLPDGLAATFVAQCTAPVLAVSGHPEEVAPSPAIRAVLAKPCMPTQLLAAIAQVTRPAAAPAPASPGLPRDAQLALDEFLAQLPAGTATATFDDGTFFTVRVELPIAMARALRSSAGDLRCGRVGGMVHIELRLCRDGRPGVHLPVLTPQADWPARAEFAVDFHDTTATAADFLRLLDQRAVARVAGRTVHFLNVPAHLSSHGKAHDMPMSGPVGPRLQPEHADLWSQP